MPKGRIRDAKTGVASAEIFLLPIPNGIKDMSFAVYLQQATAGIAKQRRLK